MRWLQSISFSASPSSSSSSSSASTSSSFLYSSRTTSSGSSPKNPDHDGHRKSLSQNEQNNNHRHNHRRFRIIAPRLTRQRKLRHLTDQDLVPKKSQAEPLALSRSTSCQDQCTPESVAGHRSKSASIAVPLPLPLPDGEQRHLSPKELGHGKFLEDRIRDRDGDRAERPAANAPPTPISSTFAARDARQTSENVDSRSSTSRVASREESSRDAFRISVPPRSAPASPYASPALSPQRKSAAAADIFPIPYIIPGNQVWSAPEMQLDIPGLPPPAYFDYTTYTADNTPLHSPPNRSPRRDTRSPSGPASPLHPAKLSLEPLSTTMRTESNGPLSGHRLPLPPGAALSSPSSSSPTLSMATKLETLPMNNQWKKGKLIGRGTFGSVYVASNRETGALCAMKEVELFPDDPKSAECIKQLEQEIKILSQLKHPNIVQYYGSEIVEDRFYIYLEYVHPGSINKYVREHCGAMTESIVRNFTRHILCGLAYLHSTKTIHRDIKGANLLVDALGVVKLADFGMSKHLSGQRADLSLKGSPYWMAPELMQAVMQKDNNPDLALAVDIWSLGCTIIEMFTGKPPWSDYEGAAAMFKVMRDTPPIPETLSPEGKDFLRCCFRRNPAERATANMLLEHRFLKNSTQSGMKSADLPSQKETSDVKLDQLPLHPQSAKGGASESKTAQRSHHEVSNLRMPSHHSPRSTLEAVPSLSPPRSGRNRHYY